MGRRALRQNHHTLDLSRHHFEAEQLPQPWTPDALLGRAAPWELEVGTGKGLFLSAAAQAEPERNFVGIEIATKYARFSAARLARLEVDNACLIHGDAEKIVAAWIPDGVLAAVHVYFPDPWWKARHRKRRVLNDKFALQIQRVLQPGGLLHFWTDVQEYFETAVAMLKEKTQLEGPLAVVEPPAMHDLDYRTHFERRTRLNNEPVYRCQFRKQA